MRTSNRILAVDPGVMGTGWAVVEEGEKLILRSSGTITPTRKDAPWLERLQFVSWSFDAVMVSIPVDSVVIESPAFHSGVAGLAVAATGSLTKLAMLTGSLIAKVQARDLPLVLATPSQWKGQLPKDVTWKRCKKILDYYGNVARTTSHARDAVGIGLWALGKF